MDIIECKCSKCCYEDMIKNKFGMVYTIENCDIYRNNICPEYTNPTKCKYSLEIPNVGICCGVYSKSKRPDGLYWAHYPICKIENCPLANLDLLEGAELVL